MNNSPFLAASVMYTASIDVHAIALLATLLSPLNIIGNGRHKSCKVNNNYVSEQDGHQC